MKIDIVVTQRTVPWDSVFSILHRSRNVFYLSVLTFVFGTSKMVDPSHRDGSVEYPKYIFWLGNKKISLDILCAYLMAYFEYSQHMLIEK